MLLPSWQTLTALSFPTNFFGRLAMPVTILLILVLAHTLAYLTWNLWPGPESSPTPPRPLAARPTIAQGPDSEVIVKTHLFGKVDQARPMAATPMAVPETPLNLTLRGIIAASFPDGGAIIAEQGGSDHFFQVGALITNGVVLQEVHPDHVILARNQRLETLRLPREFLGTNHPQSDNTVPEPPKTNLESSKDDDGNVQSLSYYRDQLFDSPGNVVNLIQAQPVYQGAKLQGFRVRPSRKNEKLFKRYGLQPNDIVTRINGVALDNPMKAFEVLNDLRNATTLSVELSRQGRTENITLPFDR
ncbi:general secretion pathway protein C [Gammaproteobacteria bacterium]